VGTDPRNPSTRIWAERPHLTHAAHSTGDVSRTPPSLQPARAKRNESCTDGLPTFAVPPTRIWEDARIQHAPRPAPEARCEVSPPRTGVPGLRCFLRNLGRVAVGRDQKTQSASGATPTQTRISDRIPRHASSTTQQILAQTSSSCGVAPGSRYTG